jgi:Dolichyl-phosphate-mannose-protein mannosyltransferase
VNAGAGSRQLFAETKVIIGFSFVALLVHLLTNQHYGYFRDELYFIACARHLDFGYVDLAPLSVLLLRIELMLFGTSLFALRLFPAIAGSFIIALTGLVARELGGRVWAVALSCIAALCAPVYLSVGNFYSLNVYGPILWTGCAYVLIRIINGGSPRWWFWFGIIVGLGLENKHSIAFFAAALIAGVLVTPERRHFARPWVWLGALIALLFALPNIVWQMQHGWPTWVLLQNIAHSHKNVVLTPTQFIAQQVLLMNPATLPIWLGGLIWQFVSREGRRYRALGFAYLVALAEFIVMHGKNYYLVPAYPMLFAAGGIAIERVFELRMWWLKPVLAAAMIALAVIIAPVAIPILPPEKLIAYMRTIHLAPPWTETSHTAALPQLFADQFGWEEMVRSVARVHQNLSPEEQRQAAIFCQNYGEAGAIDLFGPKYGLPQALSGHQNYFFWGPRGYGGQVVIVLDEGADEEGEQFQSVEDRGSVENSPWAMPWEQRVHVYICRGLKGTLRDLWPKLRNWY